jgi:ATP-dependent Clp protease ATP-binding subunit ClpA
VAQEEARASGHGTVETEHELLGLLGEADGIAADVFAELGIAIGPVRELVIDRLGPGSDGISDWPLPFSTLAKQVLEVSLREALSLGLQHIGSEHCCSRSLVSATVAPARSCLGSAWTPRSSVGRLESASRVRSPGGR